MISILVEQDVDLPASLSSKLDQSTIAKREEKKKLVLEWEQSKNISKLFSTIIENRNLINEMTKTKIMDPIHAVKNFLQCIYVPSEEDEEMLRNVEKYYNDCKKMMERSKSLTEDFVQQFQPFEKFVKGCREDQIHEKLESILEKIAKDTNDGLTLISNVFSKSKESLMDLLQLPPSIRYYEQSGTGAFHIYTGKEQTVSVYLTYNW